MCRFICPVRRFLQGGRLRYVKRRDFGNHSATYSNFKAAGLYDMRRGSMMKWVLKICVAAVALMGTVRADSSVEYDFNAFSDGPINGQAGWSVYDKVKDSSAFSVMNELGTSEADGDRALVIHASEASIRCVTGEPVRWLPGQTLSVAFDFKLALHSSILIEDRPVLVFQMGNSVLNEKACWQVGLEAAANGDWRLSASLPDTSTQRINREKLLVRARAGSSISDWYRFHLVIRKLSKPDSFESNVTILDTKGNVIASLECHDTNRDSVTKAMWNLTRVYAGFSAPKDLYGLACIDHLVIESSD